MWPLDAYIRYKAALHRTPLDRYEIRIASTVKEYQDAFKLLHIAYVYQGIEPIRGIEMRITPQHVLPESSVFVAYEGDSIVGTMTTTLDSPGGLPLEHDYPEAIENLRQQNFKLVEYGSLAVVRRCWHTGVTTLLNMAAHFFSYHALDATHCVMGINPKAARIYHAMFKFNPLGTPKEHKELKAPVIGMVHDLIDVQFFLKRQYKKKMSSGIAVGIHFTEQLPACIELPRGESKDIMRWKLPRQVFRELFIAQSNRLDSLDPKTMEHLKGWRSLRTLAHKIIIDDSSPHWTIETLPYNIHFFNKVKTQHKSPNTDDLNDTEPNPSRHSEGDNSRGEKLDTALTTPFGVKSID